MAQDKDKKERKAGVPALNLRSAGAYGGASPMAAGAGAGGGVGGLLSTATLGGKVAVLVVLTALGSGAYGVVRFLAPSSGDVGSQYWHVGAQRPADKPALSAQPAAPTAAPGSGLGMVTGSLDDRTAAQRAADDAARAAADQKAAEDMKAAAAASANSTPAAAAGSLTAQAGGPKPSPFKEKFGALSHGSSDGGQIGAVLNGGQGLAGGVGLGFDHQLSAPKNFSASRGKPAAQSALMARRTSSRGRGFAYQQLARANGLSRQGAAASGETSSTLANQAFGGSTGAGGSPVTGGGAMGNTTGAGVTSAGGPLNGPTSANQQTGTQAPPTANHTDSTPWGPQAKLATMLLALAGVALLFAHLIAKIKSAVAISIAKFLAVAAAGLGAAAAAIGILLLKQGQTMYGAIFTGAGALISVLAIKALVNDELDPDAALHNAVGGNTTNTQTAMNLDHPALSSPNIPSTATSIPQEAVQNQWNIGDSWFGEYNGQPVQWVPDANNALEGGSWQITGGGP